MRIYKFCAIFLYWKYRKLQMSILLWFLFAHTQFKLGFWNKNANWKHAEMQMINKILNNKLANKKLTL